MEHAENDAKALAARVAGLGDDWVCRVRLLQAEVSVWRGNNDAALDFLKDPIPDSLSARDYAARRLILRSLAEGHSHGYDESTKDLDRAEQLSSSAHPELIGEIYLARGSIEVDRGKYHDALKSYGIALQKAREFHRPFLEANAAGSLGYASTWLERYDESIDWYKASLAISEASGAHATSAKTLGNLAWSYHEIGDLPSALDQFQRAEKASHLAGLDLDRAYWLLSAGTVDFDLGDLRSAESRMTDALHLADPLHDSLTIGECYENLALVALQNGQFSLARERLALAEQSNSPHPDFKHTQYDKLLGAQLDFRENKLDNAALVFSQLLTDKTVPTSLRWEAQATLAQVLAAQKRSALAEKQFAAAIATISRAQDALLHEDFRLSFLSSAIRFYDEYVNFLLAQNRTLDALRIADRSRAQTLERGLSLASRDHVAPSPRTAVNFLPNEIARRQNASLLFYWLGPTHSFLWVITPAKVSLLPLPARNEIDAAAAAYRKSFLDVRDPLESQNAYGKKLYDVLVRPAEKLIPRNSRVVILPDGSLTGLNFETLIASDPQPHYWIEDVTVSVANSLSLLARSRPDAPPASPNLLFFGEAKTESKDFPPLADEGQEAAALQKHFPADRRTFFSGAEATPSGYLASEPGRYAFIHFATHGTASITRPLESAIILSRDRDTYKLYARDIVTQPLNAYLVSISACNGSGERVLAGEGLVGLSWAFLRAGAHNVVAGLWEVSTSSAPQIFDGLYDGINKGQDPATALRNAKLSLVHSKGPHRRPFYWAPFQLYSGS